MLSYPERLVAWAAEQTETVETPSGLTAVLGEPSHAKQSAWLIVEGAAAAGQITVWDTGECEIEAYHVDSGEPLLLESHQLGSLADLDAILQRVVDAIDG